MTHRMARTLACAGAAATFVLGCSTAAAPAVHPVLEGLTWRAVAIASMTPVGGREPTLVLSSGRIMGSGGCNTFSGTYALAKGQLDVAGIKATLRQCDRAIGDTEREYMRALVSAHNVGFGTDGALELSGDGGTLRFVQD